VAALIDEEKKASMLARVRILFNRCIKPLDKNRGCLAICARPLARLPIRVAPAARHQAKDFNNVCGDNNLS
jgi:hypothetical protein